MNTSEQNQKEYQDINNWKWGVFYYSKRDSRVWTPKQINKQGWTLNFAKPMSYAWIGAFILIPIILVPVIVSLSGS
jgi:uncharacterized membrane protein